MARFKLPKYLLHLLLFLITLGTTTLAGAEWIHGKMALFSFEKDGTRWFTWDVFVQGFAFSIPFLGVLTVHEFGHYFAARYHKVRTSLPYFMPFYVGIANTIGTLGAFIRIKERVFSRTEYFDIGIAGPLAGFVVALPLLWYGFTFLPDPDLIFAVHPEYAKYGADYAKYVYEEGAGNFALGKNLLFIILENTLVQDPARMPNSYEIIHYPYLFAGYLALFFTALNLLPIGQLDGGHIGYSVLGYRRFNRLAGALFVLFVTFAGIGVLTAEAFTEEYWYYGYLYLGYLFVVLRKVVPELRQTLFLTAGVICLQVAIKMAFPGFDGYPGWLVFALILSRFLGIYHPPAPNEEPVSAGRKWMAVVALLIFVLCFSPAPFIID